MYIMRMERQDADIRKWFVAVARPRAEKRVAGRLTEAGIENFLPLQRRLHAWHDRRKWVDVPLFFSYIFVKTEERLKNKVFEVGGVLRYVNIAGRAATLTEDEIGRIRRLCAWLGEVAIEQGTIRIGDEVEILAGHFRGLRGEVRSSGKGKRLRIAIEGLNCVATVILDSEAVLKTV